MEKGLCESPLFELLISHFNNFFAWRYTWNQKKITAVHLVYSNKMKTYFSADQYKPVSICPNLNGHGQLLWWIIILMHLLLVVMNIADNISQALWNELTCSCSAESENINHRHAKVMFCPDFKMHWHTLGTGNFFVYFRNFSKTKIFFDVVSSAAEKLFSFGRECSYSVEYWLLMSLFV